MKTFVIDEHSLPEIEKRIASVNRKAAKRGAALVSMRVLRTFTQRVGAHDSPNRAYFLRRAEVEIVGSNPIIGGHVFAALLRHEEGGNIIDVAPNLETTVNVEEYRNAPPRCEHCKFKRRRYDTFLLLNIQTAKLIQVGSSCLEEFLGSEDVGTALEIWKLLTTLADLERANSRSMDDQGGGGGGRGRSSGWKLEPFVAACLADIRSRGFVSRKMTEASGGGVTTGEAADRILSDSKSDVISPSDMLNAAVVIEFIRAMRATTTFEINLVTLYKGEAVSNRDFGYVAAGVFLWKGAVEKERLGRKARVRIDEWAGKVGDKVSFRGTLVRSMVVGFDNEYGPSTLMIWLDEQGRAFQWFASGVKPAGNTGDSYQVTGSIKAHKTDARSGLKETQLTRCKIGDPYDSVLTKEGKVFTDAKGRVVRWSTDGGEFRVGPPKFNWPPLSDRPERVVGRSATTETGDIWLLEASTA